MLIRLCGLGTNHPKCPRFENWDLLGVVSLEECNLPCAVEFERCRENRFVVRGLVPWHARDIAWEGDVDVLLRAVHDEYVSRRLLNAFEVGCGDPRIELHWQTLPLDETLLITFVGCSLPDHLLDEEPMLCAYVHFF